MSAADSVEIPENGLRAESFCALMILDHALDYLKGKEVRGLFSYTRALSDHEEDLARILTPSEPLVQIAPATLEDLYPEDFPEWNPNHQPQDIYRDEVAIQRLKESL